MQRCFFSSPTLINDFPHSLHWCGLYPEWESKCKFSNRWISTFSTFVHFLPSVDIICVFRKTTWPFLTRACVGFDSTVGERARLQSTILSKSGSGHKCMLYCIAVGYHLPLQISCSTEGLLTIGACVDFDSTVGERARLQSTLLSKYHLAVVTSG